MKLNVNVGLSIYRRNSWFIFGIERQHWQCLNLSVQVRWSGLCLLLNADSLHVYTWNISWDWTPTFVRFIHASVNKRWFGLCMQLNAITSISLGFCLCLNVKISQFYVLNCTPSCATTQAGIIYLPASTSIHPNCIPFWRYRYTLQWLFIKFLFIRKLFLWVEVFRNEKTAWMHSTFLSHSLTKRNVKY